MKRWIGCLVGVLAVAVAVAACGHSCTLMEPACNLEVALEHEAWEPGTYTFRFIADGVADHCTVELPFDWENPGSCSSDRVGLGPHSFSFSAANGEYPEAVYLFGEPKRVEVVVEREGVELGSESFRPKYKRTEPNGEGCGFCDNADVSMAF